MEEFFVRFAHAAAWALGIILVLAVIGLISIIRWIVGLFVAGGRAVETGVQDVERTIERK
jgi:hypothetical protein